jgi:hypothetical protein
MPGISFTWFMCMCSYMSMVWLCVAVCLVNSNLSKMAKETNESGDVKLDAPSPRSTAATTGVPIAPNRVMSIRGATVDYKYSSADQSNGSRLCGGGGGPWGTHDNEVITSQYSWWNFVPKNLFLQFSNVANLYFLFIGVLQIIGPISTTGNTARPLLTTTYTLLIKWLTVCF